jgi:S1-C subfamily serine protease
MRSHISTLLLATGLFAQSSTPGEIAYRVTIVPPHSAAAHNGLRIGDILAEPGPLPARLRAAPADGVEISLFRLNEGRYQRTKIRITFKSGEEQRLGVTGDFGFLIASVDPGSLAARVGLRPGDFIPKINETFVHSVDDLKLVDQAYAEKKPVVIHVTRWTPEKNSFQDLELSQSDR